MSPHQLTLALSCVTLFGGCSPDYLASSAENTTEATDAGFDVGGFDTPPEEEVDERCPPADLPTGTEAGEVFPPLPLMDRDGRDVALADICERGPRLVLFMQVSLWAPPYLVWIDILQQRQETLWRDAGVLIIAIVDETEDDRGPISAEDIARTEYENMLGQIDNLWVIGSRDQAFIETFEGVASPFIVVTNEELVIEFNTNDFDGRDHIIEVVNTVDAILGF